MKKSLSKMLFVALTLAIITQPLLANTDRLSKPAGTETTVKSSKGDFWTNLLVGILDALSDATVNQSIKSDIVEARYKLDNYDNRGAIRTLEGLQRRLRQQGDYSYRRLSEHLATICSDIRNGYTENAKRQLSYIERNLKLNHGHNNGHHNNGHHNNQNGNWGNNQNNYNNGNQAFYRSIETTLRTAETQLQSYGHNHSLRALRQAETALMRQNSTLNRQFLRSVQSIIRNVEQARISQARSQLRSLINQVRDAANSQYNNGNNYNNNNGYNNGYNNGNNNHHNSYLSSYERRNRQEWMRTLSDAILMLRNNETRVARRTLQRLTTSIRNNGEQSQFNRNLVQKIQFAAMSLNDGYSDTRNVIRQLRQISGSIEQSLR